MKWRQTEQVDAWRATGLTWAQAIQRTLDPDPKPVPDDRKGE